MREKEPFYLLTYLSASPSVHPSIHPFNKYSLSRYYASGPALGAGDSIVNKTYIFCPHAAYMLVDKTHTKHLSNTMQSSNNCSEGEIKKVKMVESGWGMGVIPWGG